MRLGEYIGQKRRALGITARQLAQLAKVSDSYVSDLENDKRSASVEQMPALAAVLDLDADYLYFLKGVFPPDIRALNLSEVQVRSLFKSIRKER